MNNVIGGEFAITMDMLVDNSENLNCDDEIFSSGRCALYAVLYDIESRLGRKGRILLPNYLCDSVTNTIVYAGWSFDFYNINHRLCLDDYTIIDFSNFDAILLINYFGQISLKNEIERIKRISNLIIIEDDVQAYYEYEYSNADYSFTSFRKWFPCQEGALAKRSDGKLKKCIMGENTWVQYKFTGNILKNFSDDIDDGIILDLLEKGEEELDKSFLNYSSNVGKRIFNSTDLDAVAIKRKDNARILHEGLEKLGIEHIYSENGVPLFVPIFVKQRDELRRVFFNESIFTPKHWPKKSSQINGNCDLYDLELSLICDQRYNEEDMIKQIEVLNIFIK